MSEAEHLADSLEGLFIRPDHGWFTPFCVAVEGLQPQQTANVPVEGFNSIWAVVNHLCFWQEMTLHRLHGEPVDQLWKNTQHGWPLINDPGDEVEWRSAREKAIVANKALALMIAGLSDETLEQPIAPGRAKRYQVIQGTIAHNCYHTCEIISIRHMQKLWLERT